MMQQLWSGNYKNLTICIFEREINAFQTIQIDMLKNFLKAPSLFDIKFKQWLSI